MVTSWPRMREHDVFSNIRFSLYIAELTLARTNGVAIHKLDNEGLDERPNEFTLH